jgi:thiol-disulfide isomerase/thioredoxin
MRLQKLPLVVMSLLALTVILQPATAQTGSDVDAGLTKLEERYQEARTNRFEGPEMEKFQAMAEAFIEEHRDSLSAAKLATARTYLIRCWLSATENERVFDETTALLAVEELAQSDRVKLLYYRGYAAVSLDKEKEAKAAVDELYPLKSSTAAALQGMISQKWAAVVPGKPAPKWKLQRIKTKEGSKSESESATLSLEQLRGKYVLLDFWATWCGPCKAIMRKELEPLHRVWADDKRFELVSVGTNWRNDTAEKQAAFAKQNKYHWTKVFDADGFVTARYGVRGIPTLTLIDPEGNVIAHGSAIEVMQKVRETLTELKRGPDA